MVSLARDPWRSPSQRSLSSHRSSLPTTPDIQLVAPYRIIKSTLLTMVRLVTLVSLCVAATAGTDAFKVPKSTTTFGSSSAFDTAVHLRGGGELIPIDSTVAAKAFTAILLFQGVASTAFAKRNAETYGMKPTASDLMLTKYTGASIAFVGVVAYSLLFSDSYSVEQALGLGCLSSWLPNTLALMSLKDAGMDDGMSVVPPILNCVGAFAGLTGADWATNFFKFYAGFSFFNFAYSIVDIEKAGSSWNVPAKDVRTRFMLKGVFLWVGIVGLVISVLLNGGDITTALGYLSAIALAQNLIATFVTKEFDALGLPKSAVFVWSVIMAVLGGAMLL